MKKKIKLYLAHSYEDRFKVRKIEESLEKQYNIELHNPFYDVERDEMKELDKVGKTREEAYKSVMPAWTIEKCNEIVSRDLDAIQKCDGILTFITPSIAIGTPMEIFFCAYCLGLPVYIITETQYNHPWLRAMIDHSGGRRFKTICEFKLWLELELTATIVIDGI